MSAFITLTPQPITVTTSAKGTVMQPLWTAVDVSKFDELDLALGVLFLSSRVTASVAIETGMQNQVDGNEWTTAGAFPASIAGAANSLPRPQWQRLTVGSPNQGMSLLKYVRWRVDLSAAGEATIFIRGLARRRAF